MARQIPFRKGHSFAESDPKVRAELKKAELQLKKEMERLEKQTRTTNNFISDHQQAVKMSWRRLEMQRKLDESPTVNRRTRRSGSLISDPRKRLLFATSVSMDISSSRSETDITPFSVSRPSTRQVDDELNSSGSVPTLPPLNDLKPHTRVHHTLNTSPYISSPYAFRRLAPVMSSPLTIQRTSSEQELPPVDTSTPLDASHSSVAVPANSKTFNKEALLRAKEIMKFDSKGYDPKSFQQFYSTPDIHSELGSSKIYLDDLTEKESMSEEEMLKQLTLEDQEKLQKAKQEVITVRVCLHTCSEM